MVKKFEIIILRPLQFIFIILSIFLIIKGLWLYFVGIILCFFYLGIVGSKLHPYQNAADLAKGPLKNEASADESKLLSPETIKILVGHACTRIGILIGIVTGIALLLITGWHWYFAILVAFFAIMIVGGFLKLIFKTI